MFSDNPLTVMKSQLPPDLKATRDTLSLGELKMALATCAATTLSLGLDTTHGFDSCMTARFLFETEHGLVLAASSEIGLRKADKFRDVDLRRHPPLSARPSPTCGDLLTCLLPDETPVYLGVRKNFSWRGAYRLVNIKVAGPLTFVSFASMKEKRDGGDYPVTWEQGVLSLWAIT